MKEIQNHAFSRNWTDLIKPTDYRVNRISKTESCFIIEPLESCFALTLSHCLRRTILSSIYSNSVYAIKFSNVRHEYASIEGIKEDIPDIITNIKSILIEGPLDFKKKIILIKNVQPGLVRAGIIKLPGELKIINPFLKLFTVTRYTLLSLEMAVKSGKGYISSNEHNLTDLDINYIPIDTNFSPIRKCSYSICSINAYKKTQYSRALLNVITNGSIDSSLIVAIASKILFEQLKILIDLKDSRTSKIKINHLSFNKNLLRKIEDLELSVRSHNCLKNNKLKYIGDLVTKSESEILQMSNFGKKSLNEIKDLLEKMNLKFNTRIDFWPPKNPDALAKKYLIKEI